MKKKYLFIPGFLTVFLCIVIFISCNTINKPVRQKFTVSLSSPQIPIGEIEVQFSSFMSLGSLKKENVNVIYFPREDAVCLQYRREFITYHQFWSYNGRQTFITALQRYNEDYSSRDLELKSRKTKRKYGVVEGYLIWQMYTFTVQARANMNLELGYEFKDRAPYFLVNQREAEYKEEISRDNNRTSATVPMYFTRAQAAELEALFDQNYLRGLVSPAGGLIPVISDPERDEY